MAVADGATQAYLGETWAQILVDAWARKKLSVSQSNDATRLAIDMLATSWLEAAEPPSDAPWYVAAKASRGAHATLLGVDLRLNHRAWRWRALAIGDTSLFALNEELALEASYPVLSSRDFTSTPALLTAGGSNPDLARGRRIRATGALPRGGLLMVATDAIAKCLLAAEEDGLPLWGQAVDAVATKRRFARWVEELRGSRRIDDDDTTLLVAERVG
jgi:hypothetical protein